MNIIEAIEQAKETQTLSSDGYYGITRQAWVNLGGHVLIPNDDSDHLLNEYGSACDFTVEDVLADDWEVMEEAPENPET